VRAPDGRPLRFLGFHTDITESHRLLCELEESRLLHTQLFETSIDAILWADSDGRIIAANPAATGIFDSVIVTRAGGERQVRIHFTTIERGANGSTRASSRT
jgi:PAS domain-containing protein